MEEVLYYSALYDYYSGLLTEKEQCYFKEYFFENLSLQEIAANHNISKNAVSKSIKETKNKLDNFEYILKLNSNKNKIKKIISNEIYEKIEKYI